MFNPIADLLSTRDSSTLLTKISCGGSMTRPVSIWLDPHCRHGSISGQRFLSETMPFALKSGDAFYCPRLTMMWPFSL
jgi:hypothetical protein